MIIDPTFCGVNYQLLAVIYWSSPIGTPSCSRPQAATSNGVRYGRSNWLVAPPPYWAVPPEGLVYSLNQCSLSGYRPWNLQHARKPCTLPMRALRATRPHIEPTLIPSWEHVGPSSSPRGPHYWSRWAARHRCSTASMQHGIGAVTLVGSRSLMKYGVK